MYAREVSVKKVLNWEKNLEISNKYITFANVNKKQRN
jgi:hypothetical protein